MEIGRVAYIKKKNQGEGGGARLWNRQQRSCWVLETKAGKYHHMSEMPRAEEIKKKSSRGGADKDKGKSRCEREIEFLFLLSFYKMSPILEQLWDMHTCVCVYIYKYIHFRQHNVLYKLKIKDFFQEMHHLYMPLFVFAFFYVLYLPPVPTSPPSAGGGGAQDILPKCVCLCVRADAPRCLKHQTDLSI